MQLIHCITTKKKAKSALQKYMKAHGFELIDYDFTRPIQEQDITILLIIEPCKIDDVHTNIGSFWKDVLLLESPNVTLLLGGFRKHTKTDNYLDLFKLPKRLNDFFLQTKTLDKMEVESLQQELQIETKLRNFFDGHGDESLLSRLIMFRMTMVIVYEKLIDQSFSYEEIFDEVLEQEGVKFWKTVQHRWKIYKPFLAYTPFPRIVNEVDEILNQIENDFPHKKNSSNREKLLNAEIPQKINTIYRRLERIESYLKSKDHEEENISN